MIPQHIELARVTLEFSTPMVVGAAASADLDDLACVRDANGLPAIPGSSIAGALRHALAETDPQCDPVCCRLFGYQRQGVESHAESGQTSRLQVSWAQVHDSRDRPVPAVGVDPAADSVLRFLAAGAVRDHVRLDHRGVVDRDGKFDERLVPAGARFSFELLLDRSVVADGPGLASSDQLPDLEQLVALLASSGFRLGGRTRRGLGAFEVRRWLHRRFDLKNPDDRQALAQLPVDLAAPVPAGVLNEREVPQPAEIRGSRNAVLRLTPEDFFLVGEGAPFEARERTNPKDRYTHVDRFPYREHRVLWEEGRGTVTERPELVIPATGIKGALRHRVAFHAHVLLGRFADGKVEGWDDGAASLVESLFGSARDEDAGVPGRVLVSEGRKRSYQHGLLSHVSLDRFTRGPMDGALFGEAPVWGQGDPWEVQVQVLGWADLEKEARSALEKSLKDLCEGRLAIGSGANRGHGYMNGEIRWVGSTVEQIGGGA